MLPVVSARMPTLVRITMISTSNPSRAKKPSFAARWIGHADSPGEEGAMRVFSADAPEENAKNRRSAARMEPRARLESIQRFGVIVENLVDDARLDLATVLQLAQGIDLGRRIDVAVVRSEEHTSELQSRLHLVCR